MAREVCGICWCPYDEDTGECACAPESLPTQEPPCATQECMPSQCPNCASLQDQNTELDRKLAEMEAKLNNPSVDDAFRILAEANRRAIDYINELEAERNALKAADKQRKPLNEFDALRLITSTVGLLQSAGPVEGMIGIIRAVERAHGIGGET